MTDEEPKSELIVAPTHTEIVELGASCQIHWLHVHYNIAVFIKKVGNPLAGEKVVADHVFGRVMGERSDLKTFFASVILPWIWEPDYDWKPIARTRLDSFLEKDCECDARTEETKVCKFHQKLIAEWDTKDCREMEITRSVSMARPPATEGGGVFPTSQSMHKDYPWVRETKDGHFVCTICEFSGAPQEAFWNPSYRNIFIRKHSHCGFGDARVYKPRVTTSVGDLKKRQEVAGSDIEADIKILEDITSEVLDPNSPSPGHPVGCPCHRCRIAEENRKRTIDGEGL